MRIWALERIALLHMVRLLTFLPLITWLRKMLCYYFQWLLDVYKKDLNFMFLHCSWSCNRDLVFTIAFYHLNKVSLMCCCYRVNLIWLPSLYSYILWINNTTNAWYQITEVLLEEDPLFLMIVTSMSQCSSTVLTLTELCIW